MYRAFHICSTYANFHDEVVRIKGILKENCFPLPLVDRVIKTFLDQQFSKGPPPSREEKEFLIFCLPFLGRYSLQVKTKLTRLFKQCYPTVKLKVISILLSVCHLILGLRIASLFSCAHLYCTHISVLAAMPCTLGKQPVI